MDYLSNFQHRTVLLDEAIDALAIKGTRADGIYLDGTFGCGGHSRKILECLSSKGRLIAFDKDPAAIMVAKTITDPRFTIVHDSFAMLDQLLITEKIVNRFDGVLLDLGVSSPQIDDATRGFSFRFDGPLDMRMDNTRGISAAKWLAITNEKKIAKVIKNYGEERFAFQIAKAIVTCRTIKPITTTRQLATLVAQTVKTREKNKNPATRTFQAIRIFINQELKELEIGLYKAFQHMAQQGRLVVISFHSLEDRIIKNFMMFQAHMFRSNRYFLSHTLDLPIQHAKLLQRIKPSLNEVNINPRARSAIMRVIECTL